MSDIHRELSILRSDITRTAQASKFTTKANRASIEEHKAAHEKLEGRVRDVETGVPARDHRIEQLEEQVKELQKLSAARDGRIQGMINRLNEIGNRTVLLENKDREHTGKIHHMEIEAAKDTSIVAVHAKTEEQKTARTREKYALWGSIVVAVGSSIYNLLAHLLGFGG